MMESLKHRKVWSPIYAPRINLFHYTFLDGKRFETVDIGTSLERVLRYYTLNGKLTKVRKGVCVGIGVDPALKDIGIKEIEIDFKNAHVAFIFEGTYLTDFYYKWL